MHPYHLIHATHPPRSQYTSQRFLQLLDDLNLDDRDEVLTPVYLAYEIEWPETGDPKADKLGTYRNFRAKFIERSEGLVAKLEVYGLISLALAKAYEKVFSGLRHSLDRQFEAMTGSTAEAVAEMSAHVDEIVIDIEASKRAAQRSINSLIREVGRTRRAYEQFCELVIKPLLEDEVAEPGD